MRRALAMMKYLPAVLCGLLVVAWVVSHVLRINLAREENARIGVDLRPGRLDLWWGDCPAFTGVSLESYDEYGRTEAGNLLGELSYFCIPERPWEVVYIPIPLLLSLLFPLALGPFVRFRFPLWSYFAWTALLAAELAYYLR
jgi:hypothetical protein